MALLRDLFGPGVEKLTLNTRQFQTPGGTKLELHTVSSNYHVELTPSDVGLHDRVVVQDIIKEIAQTQQVDVQAARRFKVVVMNEADRLSKDAQQGLRRTMEKYMGNLRLILCCTSTSKLMDPIRSRCLMLRVPAPDTEGMARVLMRVGQLEHVTLSEAYARRIGEKSDMNMRKAILMLEAAAVQSNPLNEEQDVPLADWEVFVQQVAQMMVAEQSPARLLDVRGKLYELIAHCIPEDVILKTLAWELMQRVDAGLKAEIVKQAAFYEHRLRSGNKAIYHLEAFVAKFMSMYKRFLLDLYG
jgi:replication factor C subunit 3/5